MKKTEINISVTAKQNGFVVDVYGNRYVGKVAVSETEAVEQMLEQVGDVLRKELSFNRQFSEYESTYKSYKITVEANDTLKDLINKQ